MEKTSLWTKIRGINKRFLFLFFSLLYLNLSAQEGVNSTKWGLVWEDNFNFFDSLIWHVTDNFDHYGEITLYSKDNVYVQNGMLVIEVKEQTYSCPQWAIDPNWFCVRQFRTGEPYKYTSGFVESKKAYDLKFGLIEARIKFPFQEALNATFWTFSGSSIDKPTNAAEIDIVELVGPLGSKTLTTNIHKGYCDESNPSYKDGCPEIVDYFKIHKPRKYEWTEWHTYGVEWSIDKMSFYVDGKRIRTIKNHGIIDPVKILFNISLSAEKEKDASLFPQKMLVDYVRTYQQKKM